MVIPITLSMLDRRLISVRYIVQLLFREEQLNKKKETCKYFNF